MKKLKISLGGVWLIVSLATLLYPVFFPTYHHASGFRDNAMAASITAMFFLSFPSSMVATPVIFMLSVLMNVNHYSMEASFLAIVILFLVGVIQWFWILPRIVSPSASIQGFDLSQAVGNRRLFARDLFTWLDADGSSPLERAIDWAAFSREGDPRSQPARVEDLLPSSSRPLAAPPE